MKLFGNVIMRIVATFVASALGVIGAGAIGGVPIWAAASMGGILAVAKVVELLSLAFLEDGKLTKAEINAAFRQTVALKDVASEDTNPTPVKTAKKAKADHSHASGESCETCGK
jgi:hypothetical protein